MPEPQYGVDMHGALLRVSFGDDCQHCGEPIDPGFLEFRLIDAWHRESRCEHWLCLRCCAAILKRWTRQASVSYREPEAASR